MIPVSLLAPLVNGYSIDPGPPKRIVVPSASSLARLQEVIVSGTLLKKQVITIDPSTGTRSVHIGQNGGAYAIEADGDLHFCIGEAALRPHITCELQHAAARLAQFQASIGSVVSVSGFFRCLFEHPGFRADDDAHVFEIHPAQGVTLAGKPISIDVDLPDPGSIHTWSSPHPLNVQDERIRVAYDRNQDALTFVEMDGQDENYVRVPGALRDIRQGSAGTLSSFTLASPDVGHPLQVLVLPNTRAESQLRAVGGTTVSVVGLRNIDLGQALSGRYVINLVAIDIQSGA